MSNKIDDKIKRLKTELKKVKLKHDQWETMNNYPCGNSGNPYKKKMEQIKHTIKTLQDI